MKAHQGWGIGLFVLGFVSLALGVRSLHDATESKRAELAATVAIWESGCRAKGGAGVYVWHEGGMQLTCAKLEAIK